MSDAAQLDDTFAWHDLFKNTCTHGAELPLGRVDSGLRGGFRGDHVVRAVNEPGRQVRYTRQQQGTLYLTLQLPTSRKYVGHAGNKTEIVRAPALWPSWMAGSSSAAILRHLQVANGKCLYVYPLKSLTSCRRKPIAAALSCPISTETPIATC